MRKPSRGPSQMWSVCFRKSWRFYLLHRMWRKIIRCPKICEGKTTEMPKLWPLQWTGCSLLCCLWWRDWGPILLSLPMMCTQLGDGGHHNGGHHSFQYRQLSPKELTAGMMGQGYMPNYQSDSEERWPVPPPPFSKGGWGGLSIFIVHGWPIDHE